MGINSYNTGASKLTVSEWYKDPRSKLMSYLQYLLSDEDSYTWDSMESSSDNPVGNMSLDTKPITLQTPQVLPQEQFNSPTFTINLLNKNKFNPKLGTDDQTKAILANAAKLPRVSDTMLQFMDEAEDAQSSGVIDTSGIGKVDASTLITLTLGEVKSIDPKSPPEVPSDSFITPVSDSENPTLGDKFKNSTFGKNFAAWSLGADAAAGIIGDRPEMNGPNAGISRGILQGWDAASDALALAGPYGQMASLAMKGINVGNNLAGKLGGGTDGMTVQDSILGSPLGFVTGVGLVNGFGGLHAETITKDEDVFALIGSSYGGSGNAVDEALKKSGKKYGLFSGSALGEANRQITEAKRQQSLMSAISDEAKDRRDIASYMSDINSRKYLNVGAGGYNQSSVRAAKEGATLEMFSDIIPICDTEINLISSDIELFKEGGQIEENKEYVPEDPDKIIKFVNKHKKVNFVLRLKDSFRESILNWEDDSQITTHKLAWAEDRDKFKVFPMVLEINGELYDFTNPEYKHGKWDALESAEKNNDVIIFDNADDADWFTKHYKDYYPTFDKYAKGGRFNVIPEGALHARLHHMDEAEHLTKKGIPVVSEGTNGKLELQAEIERDEIIYSLDVTKKLESLLKIYYDSESTQKLKDDAALEAGKLLVLETLYNTVDRTGLLNK